MLVLPTGRNELRDVDECLAGPFWPAGQLLVRPKQESGERVLLRVAEAGSSGARVLASPGGERQNREENGGIGARSPGVR
eukprot:5123244-Amphidinium_carterae.1